MTITRSSETTATDPRQQTRRAGEYGGGRRSTDRPVSEIVAELVAHRQTFSSEHHLRPVRGEEHRITRHDFESPETLEALLGDFDWDNPDTVAYRPDGAA